MTIVEYQKNNQTWDIKDEYELDFVEPDNEEEAIQNIRWALDNCPFYETLATVVRSYYGSTITWD